MANTRTDAVGVARSKRGVRESPPGSNRVEFSAWYGLVGPWCAMFVSWTLDRVGNQSGYRFASCASSVAWARRNGRLKPVSQARPGDVMVKMYTATTGHTAILGANEGSAMVTVEGNTGGSDRDGGEVMERRRVTSFWHYCIGIDYDTVAPPTTPPMTPPTTPPGAQVETLPVDGVFGRNTKGALQRSLNRSGAKPQLTVDCDFGLATKRMLQARLNHVRGPVAIDGDIGPQTIRAMQAHTGAAVDGDWGSQTTSALQKALNAGKF